MNRSEHESMRRGKLSGSKAAALMSGSFKQWNRLLKDLRSPQPFYGLSANTPAPLAHGLRNEPKALGIWWERHPALDLLNPGCVPYHDSNDPLWWRNAVVSPDRLVFDPAVNRIIAGIECKAPYNETQFPRWLDLGRCPDEHYAQCAFGQLITGLPSWRFIAYDPRWPEGSEFLEYEVAAPPDYLERMYELGTQLLRMYESGGEFEPTSRTAGNLKEMFHGH